MEQWVDDVIDKIIDWTIESRLNNIKRIVDSIKQKYPGRAEEEYVDILETRWSKMAGIWGGLAQIPSVIPGIGMLTGIGSASVEILGSILYQTQLILAIMYIYDIDLTADSKLIVRHILIDALDSTDHASKLGASITTSSTKRIFKRTVRRSINRLIGRGVGRYVTRAIPGGLSMVIGYMASRRFAKRVKNFTITYINDLKLLEGKKQLLLEDKVDLSTEASDSTNDPPLPSDHNEA